MGSQFSRFWAVFPLLIWLTGAPAATHADEAASKASCDRGVKDSKICRELYNRQWQKLGDHLLAGFRCQEPSSFKCKNDETKVQIAGYCVGTKMMLRCDPSTGWAGTNLKDARARGDQVINESLHPKAAQSDHPVQGEAPAVAGQVTSPAVGAPAPAPVTAVQSYGDCPQKISGQVNTSLIAQGDFCCKHQNILGGGAVTYPVSPRPGYVGECNSDLLLDKVHRCGMINCKDALESYRACPSQYPALTLGQVLRANGRLDHSDIPKSASVSDDKKRCVCKIPAKDGGQPFGVYFAFDGSPVNPQCPPTSAASMSASPPVRQGDGASAVQAGGAPSGAGGPK